MVNAIVSAMAHHESNEGADDCTQSVGWVCSALEADFASVIHLAEPPGQLRIHLPKNAASSSITESDGRAIATPVLRFTR